MLRSHILIAGSTVLEVGVQVGILGELGPLGCRCGIGKSSLFFCFQPLGIPLFNFQACGCIGGRSKILLPACFAVCGKTCHIALQVVVEFKPRVGIMKFCDVDVGAHAHLLR